MAFTRFARVGVLTLTFILVGCFGAERDDTGAVVTAGAVSPFDVKVGDCLKDPGVNSEEDEVFMVTAVPCSQPHDSEIFSMFGTELAAWPGSTDAMFEHATHACLAHFESFVGMAYEDSVLELISMYPTRDSWSLDDREIVCSVAHMEGEMLTGSARGLAI